MLETILVIGVLIFLLYTLEIWFPILWDLLKLSWGLIKFIIGSAAILFTLGTIWLALQAGV